MYEWECPSMKSSENYLIGDWNFHYYTPFNEYWYNKLVDKTSKQTDTNLIFNI